MFFTEDELGARLPDGSVEGFGPGVGDKRSAIVLSSTLVSKGLVKYALAPESKVPVGFLPEDCRSQQERVKRKFVDL